MATSVPPTRGHRTLEVDTPRGAARAFVVDPSSTHGETATPSGTLVLGHGAGKGTNTADLHGLLALADGGWRVVLVDQPWVVAGGRVATPPSTLDEAWVAVIDHLRQAGEIIGSFVQGGRSAGARVACRTAAEVGAGAVVALAFPLVPPGKADLPEKWRTPEAAQVLDAGIPLLVVQGERDAFGGPEAIRTAVPEAQVVAVGGAHGFLSKPLDVVVAVEQWLTHHLRAPA